MPGTNLNPNRPWSRLDLPNGDCIPLEQPCPECAGTQVTRALCKVCRGVGRIPTPAGMNVLALVATHPMATVEA